MGMSRMKLPQSGNQRLWRTGPESSLLPHLDKL
jgi:hypothetical protein